MAWLESGIEKGFHPYDFIARHNPFLASLRGTPEFTFLAEKARRRIDAFEV